MPFTLAAPFQPTGDQPQAITELVAGFKTQQHQTLLGVTGSGKTFTMANVIQQLQLPTLIIAHNKTLAAQLYQEFRDFFPHNAVSYFVSYYDYYQPEAYIPTTDTYIEKEATINDEIDKLRLAATTNLLTRPDTIVVASVSCIYNLGSPVEYSKNQLVLVEGEVISRETLFLTLQQLQYQRTDTDFSRGSFRVRGDTLQIWPAYEDKALRIETLENQIERIRWIDPISGQDLTDQVAGSPGQPAHRYVIFPAKHYTMDPANQQPAIEAIEHDLQARVSQLEQTGKVLEAYRLKQKVSYDLNMLKEFGFVNGIENYSRYFDGRQPGQPPYTLLEYFQDAGQRFGQGQYLTIVDESHITLPQVRGMYFGDRSRKETLIDYGFRLPSALDNRPLMFEEFLTQSQLMMAVSATPNEYEISLSQGKVVEQLIRPTGLIDPLIEIRPTENQIEDLVIEIIRRKQSGQRVLVTTLTKKMAEALTDYLNDQQKIDQLVTHHQEQLANHDPDFIVRPYKNEELAALPIGPINKSYFSRAQLRITDKLSDYPKVAYLHSDIETLERSDILDDLRRGVFDVVVGINLLREGLDLPEVTLVAILDADKEGFLRSATSLIQTMGRAARHQDGLAILYADKMTGSMLKAINETHRRRQAQVAYNLKHNITPQTIAKPFRDRMIEKTSSEDINSDPEQAQPLVVSLSKSERIDLNQINPEAMTPNDRTKLTKKLHRRMTQAANDMDFELAAILRDSIQLLA